MMKPVLQRWGINENSLDKTATAPRITLDHQKCGRTQICAQSRFALVDGIYEAKKQKDMRRMPPNTERLSRNFLDETVFWIIAAEQEREAMRTHTSPRARHGRSSNTQFRARGFAESMHHPLIRIVSLQTG